MKLTKLENELLKKMAEDYFDSGVFCCVPGCTCPENVSGSKRCLDRIQKFLMERVLKELKSKRAKEK